jgi:tetratricopeptide (TPR) repeat protein
MKKRLYLFFMFALAAHAAFTETVDEYLLIGEQYFLEGRLHEARSVFEKAIRLAPNDARLHRDLGVIYYNLKENILALESFSRAIELDNTIAEPYYGRATIYWYILNDHAQALSNFDMAVYLDPENDKYRRNRGIFLFVTVGDSISALIDFNRAVEINPLNHLNFQQRGIFYSKYGFYEMALDDLNAAISLNSEDESNFSNKGNILLLMERYEEAVESFSIALRLDSNNDRTYAARGAAHFVLGMYNEAVLDLTEVIRINPNSMEYMRDAHSNRAYLYRLLADQSDDPAEAGYYLDRAQLDEDVVARLDGKME